MRFLSFDFFHVCVLCVCFTAPVYRTWLPKERTLIWENELNQNVAPWTFGLVCQTEKLSSAQTDDWWQVFNHYQWTNEQIIAQRKSSKMCAISAHTVLAQVLGFTMEAYSSLTLSMHWHWISKMSKKQVPNGWTAIAPKSSCSLLYMLWGLNTIQFMIKKKKSCQEKVKCCVF